MPWEGVDPVVIGAQIVSALQSIQSRQVDVNEPSVLTVGTFNGGTRANIVPDRVDMTGTLRTYGDERRRYMMGRVGELAESVARGMNGTAEVEWESNGYPTTVNDPGVAERMAPSLARVVGPEALRMGPRIMASEDLLAALPGGRGRDAAGFARHAAPRRGLHRQRRLRPAHWVSAVPALLADLAIVAKGRVQAQPEPASTVAAVPRNVFRPC